MERVTRNNGSTSLKGPNGSLFIRDYKSEYWRIGVIDERDSIPQRLDQTLQ